MKLTGVQRQHGFALVAAIFLIVALAGLGLFAVRLAGAQQQSINLALLGSRALAAANSGIEYGAYRATTAVNGCTTINNTNVSLTQSALNKFTVQMTCAKTSFTVNSVPVNAYEITATASYGTYGQPDYVSRVAMKTVNK